MRTKLKKGKAGWFHYSDMDGFGGIEFLPNGLGEALNYGDYKHRKSAYGPFKTFGEAKRDAIDFYRADVEIAKSRMGEVRRCKKRDSFYKGGGK